LISTDTNITTILPSLVCGRALEIVIYVVKAPPPKIRLV